MTNEQFQIFLEDNRKSTAEAIEKTVNGKIKSLDAKLTEHMARVEPYLQGVGGLKILFNFVLSLGALALAWTSVKGFFGR